MLIRVLVTATACLATVPAMAQEAALAPSPYLECMTLTPGAARTPVFPPLLVEAKAEARMRVEVEFSGPDAEPSIRIDKHPYSTDFDSAIKRYARNLRLPCMPAGAKPVVLTQRYVFDPTDGRKLMPPQTEDVAHDERADRLDCLKHERGRVAPPYPREALRQEREGRVLARLRFSGPAEPPKVRYLAEVGGKEFREALDTHLAGQRLPCFKPGEDPIDIDVFYIYTMEGSSQVSFKDMTLRNLLGIIKTPAPISADFNGMGCPFDVRIRYLQPHAPNRIVEIETTNPARKPLIEWLRTVQLNVARDINDKVFADRFTVSIPCGRMDL